jgi:hypothetical protein
MVKAAGHCYRYLLEELSLSELKEMDMPSGHAKAVWKILNPGRFAVADGVPLVGVLEPQFGKFVAAPQFPKLDVTGLPSVRDLKAWLPGAYNTLSERGCSTAELKACQADPKAALAESWEDGSVLDRALWAALSRCDKGLPVDLMLSFSASIRFPHPSFPASILV